MHPKSTMGRTRTPSWPWVQRPEVRAATAAQVREMALTTSFLASEGLALTVEADALFVAAVRRG